MARHLFEKHWYLRFWLPPHQFGCFKKWEIGGGTVIKNLLARKVTYFIEISIPYLLLRIQKLCNKALLCRLGLQFNCFKRFSDLLGWFHGDTLLHVILQLSFVRLYAIPAEDHSEDGSVGVDSSATIPRLLKV